ncbi:MAG: preprotein translocase subunit SecY [Acidimicrobiia bacterium]|nr:preprotein translocase subunit SecY [Acidimicrobiia bacterium]
MSTLRNIVQTPELRNKILFTIFIIVVYRLGVQIPAPGVSLDAIEQLRAQSEETSGGIFGYLNLFTGGGLASLSLFSLGILPYITSSIIIQILTVAVPKLEEWQSQGAIGQRKITQWTRYITILLALVQSTGIVFIVGNNPEAFFGVDVGLFPDSSPGRVIMAVMCMTAGTALVMWMGELITQKGIGNGMSMIIFASVVSGLPALGIRINAISGWVWLIVALLLLVVLCAGIVFVEQGQRRIPVNFAKRVVGRRQYGGNNTYIPLKVNQAGVIPVIFASSLLQLPSLIANVLPTSGDPLDPNWGDQVRDFITSNLFQPDNLGYILVFGALIVGFAYFYNAIAFDPVRRADELRKSGGFIPGIRPGPQTERHLAKILNRITLPGALFLALVALIPSAALARLLGSGSNNAASLVGFSGVSILIAVGVSLETMKQINSQLMARNYDGFLK